jgi:hypothetical protein
MDFGILLSGKLDRKGLAESVKIQQDLTNTYKPIVGFTDNAKPTTFRTILSRFGGASAGADYEAPGHATGFPIDKFPRGILVTRAEIADNTHGKRQLKLSTRLSLRQGFISTVFLLTTSR